MKRPVARASISLALAACPLLTSAQASAAASRATSIYEFPVAGGAKGSQPSGTFVSDTAGNLYGTATGGGPVNGGQVFMLSRSKSGKRGWTYKSLHNFVGTDGAAPVGRLARDGAGNLYGSTFVGGAQNLGTIFRLAMPTHPGGNWSLTTLYSFGAMPNDAVNPNFGVTLDRQGNIYGTTPFGGPPTNAGFTLGTVFRLTPPAGGVGEWTETILHYFQGVGDSAFPDGEVLVDSDATIYGTARGGYVGMIGLAVDFGAVFALSPSRSGKWTYTALHKFNGGADGIYPSGNLLADAAGNLYGTTYTGGATNFGTVYEVRPPAPGHANWAEQVIHTFSGLDNAPAAGLAADASGNLYGTTLGAFQENSFLCGGTVFRLSPPVANSSIWTETSLVTFGFPKTFALGCGVEAAGLAEPSVLVAPSGTLYGANTFGGLTGNGAAFSIVP